MALKPSPLVLGIGWNFGIGSPKSSRATLSIAGTPVTEATQDEGYTGFTVSAAGGLAPYSFTVASGTLPTGITLGPTTGVVAGTPTVAETQTGIIIRVVDKLFSTADLAAFQIVVSAGLPPPPEGFAYVVDSDGAYYVDGDGKYWTHEEA